jgi:hypothetical protein
MFVAFFQHFHKNGFSIFFFAAKIIRRQQKKISAVFSFFFSLFFVHLLETRFFQWGIKKI